MTPDTTTHPAPPECTAMLGANEMAEPVRAKSYEVRP